MGCDGGSLVKREDVVKMKKRPDKLNQADIDVNNWSKCSLLQDPLQEPIVCDDLGNLFNKDNVIQALLDGSLSSSDSFSHIKSLKSIYNVNFSNNPSYSNGNSNNNGTKSKWYCPITKNEVGGHQVKFLCLKPCGHVLSEKSIRELSMENCFVCSKKFDRVTDTVLLNPSAEELTQIKQTLSQLKKPTKKKSIKKEKKVEKESKDNNNTTTTTTTTTTTSNTTQIKSITENEEDNTTTTTTTTSTNTNNNDTNNNNNNVNKKRQHETSVYSNNNTTIESKLNSNQLLAKSAVEKAAEITKKMKANSSAFAGIFSKS